MKNIISFLLLVQLPLMAAFAQVHKMGHMTIDISDDIMYESTSRNFIVATDSFTIEKIVDYKTHPYEISIRQLDASINTIRSISITSEILKEGNKLYYQIGVYRGHLVIISTAIKKINKQKRTVVYGSLVRQSDLKLIKPETMLFDLPVKVDYATIDISMFKTSDDAPYIVSARSTKTFDKLATTKIEMVSLGTDLDWSQPMTAELPVALATNGSFQYYIRTIKNHIFILSVINESEDRTIYSPKLQLSLFSSDHPVVSTEIQLKKGELQGIGLLVDNYQMITVAGYYLSTSKDDVRWGNINGQVIFYQKFDISTFIAQVEAIEQFEAELPFELITKGFNDEIIADCVDGKSNMINLASKAYSLSYIYFRKDGTLIMVVDQRLKGPKTIQFNPTGQSSTAAYPSGGGDIMVIGLDSNNQFQNLQKIKRDPTWSFTWPTEYILVDVDSNLYIIMYTLAERLSDLTKEQLSEMSSQTASLIEITVGVKSGIEYSVISILRQLAYPELEKAISQKRASMYIADGVSTAGNACLYFENYNSLYNKSNYVTIKYH
jgi:hypothetical protein